MPEDVKDRLHAMARRAKADQGLSFTDGDGKNLDNLYPDDATDEDYDPDDDDDDQSRESSQSSDTSGSDTSRDETDLPTESTDGRPAIIIQAPTITLQSTLPIQDQGHRNPITETGITGATGVGARDLETYVDRLEAQLEDEISGLNTTPDIKK